MKLINFIFFLFQGIIVNAINVVLGGAVNGTTKKQVLEVK